MSKKHGSGEECGAPPSPLSVRRGCFWCCIFYAVGVWRWSQVKSWTLTYSPTKARVRFDASLLADWNIQSIRPFQLPLSISLSHNHPLPCPSLESPLYTCTCIRTQSAAHADAHTYPRCTVTNPSGNKEKRTTEERDNIRSLIEAKRSVNWPQIEKNSAAVDVIWQLTIKIHSSF